MKQPALKQERGLRHQITTEEDQLEEATAAYAELPLLMIIDVVVQDQKNCPGSLFYSS